MPLMMDGGCKMETQQGGSDLRLAFVCVLSFIGKLRSSIRLLIMKQDQTGTGRK